MTKDILYTYLGTNGTLTTIIHLENIYSIKSVRLVADYKKKMTKDFINYFSSVTIQESEIDEWYEVDDPDWAADDNIV